MICEFIIYPTSQQAYIDGLNIDLGKPRVHPNGALSITNLNGGVPFNPAERVMLASVDGLIFIPSDPRELMEQYLSEGGWNAVEELP